MKLSVRETDANDINKGTKLPARHHRVFRRQLPAGAAATTNLRALTAVRQTPQLSVQHANVIAQAKANNGCRAQGLVLQLQRRYGNRYIQSVLDLSIRQHKQAVERSRSLRRQVSKPLAHNSPARSGVFLQRQQQPPQQQPQQQPPQQQPPQQQPPQQQPPQQQPAQPQQNVVLEVEMEVQHNIVDAQGNVVGVSGTQTLTYTDSNGNQIREVHNNVQWREDATVEAGQATPYEHPAAVERFSIVHGTGRYPISTTHSERGIAIHAPGRSEGCILANQGVRNDIQNRLNNNEQIQGEITNITDTRTPAEQQVAPLPQ